MKNLAIKILLNEFLIRMIPISVLIVLFLQVGQANFQDNLFFYVFFLIIIFSIFSLISIFLNVSLVLNPIKGMVNAMSHYQLHNQYKPFSGRTFSEAEQLQAAIVNLVKTIKQQDLELLRSKKLRAIGKMAFTVAHEIRNPLTTIRGSFQLLQAKPNDTVLFNKFAPIIVSELDRMNGIVEDLLNYSREHKLLLNYYKLSDIVEEILLMQQQHFQDRNIFIKNEISDCLVFTDRNRIIQVILNMVRNSADAITDSGEIVLQEIAGTGYITLAIKDTGVGLSKEDLEKVGTPFFTTKKSGTGLGFATSMKIMNELGGRLDIESELSKGTTVLIRIPTVNQYDEMLLG